MPVTAQPCRESSAGFPATPQPGLFEWSGGLFPALVVASVSNLTLLASSRLAAHLEGRETAAEGVELDLKGFEGPVPGWRVVGSAGRAG